MAESKDSKQQTQPSLTEEGRSKIADRVREDSSSLGRPTPLGSVAALVPDVAPELLIESLAAMAEEERWQDIQSLTALSGAVYLYSDEHLTSDEALDAARAEEIQAGIADRVRGVSKHKAELTAAVSLSDLAAEVEPAEIEAALSAMADDERYRDIKTVTAAGAAYLYSDTHVTRNYADILARAVANDPCGTIAATVRDESRIYPRPTQIRLFREAVFNINPDAVETHVARTLERPEYRDVKKIVASTGAVYLYSDQYLDPAQAEALVEWNEVGQYKNP